MRLIYFFFLTFCAGTASAAYSISIEGDSSLLETPNTRFTIQDVTQLLRKACNCSVEWNKPAAYIRIKLPSINPEETGRLTAFEEGKPYPVLHYPESGYAWTSKESGNAIVLTLEAKTYNAVSFGLYGLLQEQLGFRFYHPRETLIPQLESWPLPATFTWKAQPRFHKMGFHLHTQHPLELTQDLMNPYTEEARARIKEYIDWLARNQQNYFEYNLLESIHLKSWVRNISEIVEYGKQRGIIMGLDISLHMIQQKAFMLYESFPNSMRSKKRQIDRNLAKLCKADWDVFDVEFSTTEFTKGNEKEKKQMQLYLSDRLVNKFGVKPMGRMHVVKPDELLDSGAEPVDFGFSKADSLLDSHRGVLIHTVMFYSLVDESAPVYQNENLKHMLHELLKEQQHRETWYYPESAYWITFDNSVPMFLMPYLSARLDDILLCDSLDVTGHVTFSSGWEWGYWLFDWSIARWSWKHEINGEAQPVAPTQFLSGFFNSHEASGFFENAFRLQQHYVKDKELIRYMTAQTVTDEFPHPLNLQLHPRPDVTYKWMRKEADTDFIKKIHFDAIKSLFAFSDSTKKMVQEAGAIQFKDSIRSKVFAELRDGIHITALRAQQREIILSTIFELNESDSKKNENCSLHLAEQVRLNALTLVRRREVNYRYPLELLAGKYRSNTSYNHGYLYSVHDLHFWKREEMQIQKDRWGPMFMSMWNISRIIGLKN